MRRSLCSSLLACSVVAACGCGERDAGGADRTAPAVASPASVASPAIATVTVDELDRMLARDECQAVDANGSDTRRNMGVIPGAVLLPDADSLAGLPADRTRRLVFYCVNPACRSSEHAAQQALAAGYSRVHVLPDGIAGWVKAGKKTAAL
jgi:rhodanese-related sulfurtransferase